MRAGEEEEFSLYLSLSVSLTIVSWSSIPSLFSVNNLSSSMGFERAFFRRFHLSSILFFLSLSLLSFSISSILSHSLSLSSSLALSLSSSLFNKREMRRGISFLSFAEKIHKKTHKHISEKKWIKHIGIGSSIPWIDFCFHERQSQFIVDKRIDPRERCIF